MERVSNKTSGSKPITPGMREATAKVIRRIAELKIQYYDLKDTPEEYIEKCREKKQ